MSLCSLLVRIGVALTLAVLPAAAPARAQTNAHPDWAGWRQALTARLVQPRFAQARWGLEVVSLDSGKTLFAHDAEKLFTPASNAKLFTGALALDHLGPGFRIRTSFYAAHRPDPNGTLPADLILYGRGDPTLGARGPTADLEAALAPLVEALAQAGVRRVEGDLVADASFFTGPPWGTGWEWDDLQEWYGAEVSALTFNDNVAEVRVAPGERAGVPARISVRPPDPGLVLSNGVLTIAPDLRRDLHFYRAPAAALLSVSGRIPADGFGAVETLAVPQPAAWLGQGLKQALARRGIAVTGTVRVRPAPEAGPAPSVRGSLIELGGVESPPLRDLLARTFKPSQNLYAQLLLLQVGETVRAHPTNAPPGLSSLKTLTSEAAGLQALKGFLRAAGIAPETVLLEEGAGLSHGDLVTPAATVRLLQFMARHRWQQAFLEALPVAGVDGTLKHRMLGTPAAGNLHAKTGSLNHVASLSGYVTTAAGERLAFAMFLNNYADPDGRHPARADLDDLAVTLARLPWRSEPPAPLLTPVHPE